MERISLFVHAALEPGEGTNFVPSIRFVHGTQERNSFISFISFMQERNERNSFISFNSFLAGNEFRSCPGTNNE